MVASTKPARPVLRQRFQVPFDELEPEPFATFVHGCLHPIAEDRGWTGLQQPDVGPDGGFDSWATIQASGHLVCIQCKRYATSISLPQVGHELAKVALRTVLEGSTVSEHLLVTSGNVAEVLRSALREQSRQKLEEEALKQLRKDKLRRRLEQVISAGNDGETIVRAYVQRVRLMVWSGHEFDIQLGLVWDRITSLLERTFAVQTLIQEFPRPDFDEEGYRKLSIQELDHRWVDPRCTLGSPPHNISARSAGDPLKPSIGPDAPDDVKSIRAALHEIPSAIEALADVSGSGLCLLVGGGGAGKTTVLKHLRAYLLEKRAIDGIAHPLPVLVRLSSIGTSLNEAICNALHIHRGHWSSIPGPILLLFDGLDELQVGSLPGFVDNLRQLLVTDDRICAIATTRENGPPRPVVMPLERTLHLLHFGPHQVAELAGKVLDSASVAAFVDAWLKTVTDDTFLTRPQAVAAALHSWSSNKGKLPDTHRELLKNVLDLMRGRERERYGPLPDRLGSVPQSTVEHFARRLIERTWFKTGKGSISTENYQGELSALLSESRNSNVFGADSLSSLDVELLLRHHGFVVPVFNGVRLPHETICAYLASDHLARTWRDHIQTRTARNHDRIWLAAMSLLPIPERLEVVSVMADVDLLFATRLAREARVLDDFEARLLTEARNVQGEYHESEVSRSLALAGTSACLSILREWMVGEGHQCLTARRALARAGDHKIVQDALTTVDRWDSDCVQVSGEERSLWDSSPLIARLVAARMALAKSTDGLLAQSFDTVGAWGTPQDVPLVVKALMRGVPTSRSLQRGFLALYHLEPQQCSRLLREMRAQIPSEIEIDLLEIAIAIGEAVDPSRLVDYILADSELPSDSNNQVATHGRLSDVQRHVALRLLKKIDLPLDQIPRVLGGIASSDPVMRYWAWSIASIHRFPQVIACARAALRNPTTSDEELHYAARMLATEPAQVGYAEPSRQRFGERFPVRLARSTAYHLATLSEADGDTEGVLEITTAVFDALVTDLESDSEMSSAAELDLGQWGDRVRSFPDILRKVGLLRILSWDLRTIGGAESLVKLALKLVDKKQFIQELPKISSSGWRCRLIRICCDQHPDLCPKLENFIALLLMQFCDWMPPHDLLEASKACWGDCIAEATIAACMQAQRSSSRLTVSYRVDSYLRELGPLFTEDQAVRFVQPAVSVVTDSEVKAQLNFLIDRARRRR